MSINRDVIIIGGGPAGIAAAIEIKKNGHDVLLLEREAMLGGILNQCIHDGFGLVKFKQALTGPEYAKRYIEEAKSLNIEIKCNVLVQDISFSEDGTSKQVTAISSDGIVTYNAKAVILAMGCRERTRGNISIPGTRPAGVFTAGVAQHLMNLKNIMVGKKIVILGSGDIGLIMARRLTLEGAEVLAVVEKLPYSSGLQRNITQCLEDFGIPLLLSHTVVNIHGHQRVEGVTIAQVDKAGIAIESTQQHFDCDTLILSVGLIPENDLSLNTGIILDNTTNGARVNENLETNIPGIFACGNVLQVHDLVDHVSSEGEKAAKSAVEYLEGVDDCQGDKIEVKVGKGIGYVVPQYITPSKDTTFSMRVTKPHKNKAIVFNSTGRQIKVGTPVFNPAEMIRINLSAKQLQDICDLEVYLDEQ